MELCGWRTRSTFERYNIIDEADRAQAVAQRFSNLNGKPTANLPAPEAPAEHVS
jgi:hypothetical protein